MKKLIDILFVLGLFLLLSCQDDRTAELPAEEINMHEGHEYVDLGLPSGTLWATADVSVDGSVFFSWGGK